MALQAQVTGRGLVGQEGRAHWSPWCLTLFPRVSPSSDLSDKLSTAAPGCFLLKALEAHQYVHIRHSHLPLLPAQ